MKLYYVYLLECCDGSFYTGVTNDISQRMIEHQQGTDKEFYTFNRRPVILKHYLIFNYINDAIFIEKKLKKLAYFNKDWKTLHEKAKCRNTSSHLLRSSEDEA